MQRPRDQLLARAALAVDQHRDVALRRLGHLRHQPPHRRRAPDHAAQRVAAVVLHLDRRAIAHAQRGVADPDRCPERDHGAIDPHRADERAVRGAMIGDRDAAGHRPQLDVIARHGRIAEPHRAALRGPDRHVDPGHGHARVRAADHLDHDAADRHRRRATMPQRLEHAALYTRQTPAGHSTGHRLSGAPVGCPPDRTAAPRAGARDPGASRRHGGRNRSAA